MFIDFQLVWNGWLEIICQSAIVITATIADLASTARRISIERDWIVVMCGGDKHELTSTIIDFFGRKWNDGTKGYK